MGGVDDVRRVFAHDFVAVRVVARPGAGFQARALRLADQRESQLALVEHRVVVQEVLADHRPELNGPRSSARHTLAHGLGSAPRTMRETRAVSVPAQSEARLARIGHNAAELEGVAQVEAVGDGEGRGAEDGDADGRHPLPLTGVQAASGGQARQLVARDAAVEERVVDHLHQPLGRGVRGRTLDLSARRNGGGEGAIGRARQLPGPHQLEPRVALVLHLVLVDVDELAANQAPVSDDVRRGGARDEETLTELAAPLTGLRAPRHALARQPVARVAAVRGRVVEAVALDRHRALNKARGLRAGHRLTRGNLVAPVSFRQARCGVVAGQTEAGVTGEVDHLAVGEVLAHDGAVAEVQGEDGRTGDELAREVRHWPRAVGQAGGQAAALGLVAGVAHVGHGGGEQHPVLQLRPGVFNHGRNPAGHRRAFRLLAVPRPVGLTRPTELADQLVARVADEENAVAVATPLANRRAVREGGQLGTLHPLAPRGLVAPQQVGQTHQHGGAHGPEPHAALVRHAAPHAVVVAHHGAVLHCRRGGALERNARRFRSAPLAWRRALPESVSAKHEAWVARVTQLSAERVGQRGDRAVLESGRVDFRARHRLTARLLPVPQSISLALPAGRAHEEVAFLALVADLGAESEVLSDDHSVEDVPGLRAGDDLTDRGLSRPLPALRAFTLTGARQRVPAVAHVLNAASVVAEILREDDDAVNQPDGGDVRTGDPDAGGGVRLPRPLLAAGRRVGPFQSEPFVAGIHQSDVVHLPGESIVQGQGWRADDLDAHGVFPAPLPVGHARALRRPFQTVARPAGKGDDGAELAAEGGGEAVDDGGARTLHGDADGDGAAPAPVGSAHALRRPLQVVALVAHVADGGVEGEAGPQHPAVGDDLRGLVALHRPTRGRRPAQHAIHPAQADRLARHHVSRPAAVGGSAARHQRVSRERDVTVQGGGRSGAGGGDAGRLAAAESQVGLASPDLLPHQSVARVARVLHDGAHLSNTRTAPGVTSCLHFNVPSPALGNQTRSRALLIIICNLACCTAQLFCC